MWIINELGSIRYVCVCALWFHAKFKRVRSELIYVNWLRFHTYGKRMQACMCMCNKCNHWKKNYGSPFAYDSRESIKCFSLGVCGLFCTSIDSIGSEREGEKNETLNRFNLRATLNKKWNKFKLYLRPLSPKGQKQKKRKNEPAWKDWKE